MVCRSVRSVDNDEPQKSRYQAVCLRQFQGKWGSRNAAFPPQPQIARLDQHGQNLAMGLKVIQATTALPQRLSQVAVDCGAAPWLRQQKATRDKMVLRLLAFMWQ